MSRGVALPCCQLRGKAERTDWVTGLAEGISVVQMQCHEVTDAEADTSSLGNCQRMEVARYTLTQVETLRLPYVHTLMQEQMYNFASIFYIQKS